jgi:hypothetical protein
MGDGGDIILLVKRISPSLKIDLEATEKLSALV